jgi:hypothetical protein
MPFKFKPSQLVLQDMATAEPGTIGWIASNRRELARLVMIVKREAAQTPECVFVELTGEHSFTARRIGDIHAGEYFILKLPHEDWTIELGEAFRTAGGHGEIGSLILTEENTYLSVLFGNAYGDNDRLLVRLSDFSMTSVWPNNMRSIIGTWKMVAGDKDNRLDLAEAQERT